MNIIEFMDGFADERSCRKSLKIMREAEGLTCNKCGCPTLYWLKAKSQWQCAQCTHRVTLKSGTIMHHSKLPVRTWFLAIALMSYSKKSISACNLQRQVGHKYEHVLNLMNKIRLIMGHEVELDSFHLQNNPILEDNWLKKFAMTPEELKIHVEKYFPGFELKSILIDKEKILPEDESIEVNMTVRDQESLSTQDKRARPNVYFTKPVKPSQYYSLNKRTRWNTLLKKIQITFYRTTGPTAPDKKWMNLIGGNFIKNLFGIHHNIKRKNLKLYLDEFVYKLNRRSGKNLAMESLMRDVVQSYW